MGEIHFSQLAFLQAKKYKKKIAVCSKDENNDTWQRHSWEFFAGQVSAAAKAFVEIGLLEHQTVIQFSHNRYENLIVDFALYANRAVVVPVYGTSTVDDLKSIVENSEAEIIFVGNEEQYNIALKLLEKSVLLKKIIVFDKNITLKNDIQCMYYSDFIEIGEKSTKHFEVEHRQNDLQETDLACIFYTSGTTGDPKGVRLLHSNFNEAMRIHKSRLKFISDTDKSVAFLPLAHVFERTWSYFCLVSGVAIYFNPHPAQIQKTLREVMPSYICSVPRFWEKIYIKVNEKILNYSPVGKAIVTWALAVGEKYNFEHLRIGKRPNLALEIKYSIADNLVFSKIKRNMGLENAKALPIAGARVPDELLEFFKCMGIPLLNGYGLTESTATVSCFEEIGYKIGSVGTLMPDVSVKIGPGSEILLKGKTIFAGYHKNQKANDEAFTKDGWYKTGDAGYFQGPHLVLTDRIKDLYKTSNGKFVAPQKIEAVLSLDKYIEQVAVIGDDRSYITALIAPNTEALEEYAQANLISYEDIDELLDSAEINEFMKERIFELQKGMVNYEHIKKFKLIHKLFSIEAGELTNTLKLRRAFIVHKYKSMIDEMYQG